MGDSLYARSWLMHHGVKGQKWGVKNGPPYPLDSSVSTGKRLKNESETITLNTFAKQNLKNATKKNVESWGKDSKHNILYITGISGSGKSTVAKSLADGAYVIHLDSYFEINNKEYMGINNNKSFDAYLKTKNFNPNTLNDKDLFDKDIYKYFNRVDEFAKLTEEFGEEQFNNGRKVIIEGVQLNDETMYPDKKYFDDKPFIKLNTNEKLSKSRASKRDSKQ